MHCALLTWNYKIAVWRFLDVYHYFWVFIDSTLILSWSQLLSIIFKSPVAIYLYIYNGIGLVAELFTRSAHAVQWLEGYMVENYDVDMAY